MKDFQELFSNITKGNIPSELKEELENEVIEEESGGGLVKVSMNYVFELKDVRIDESIFNKNDKVLLEQLLISAINSAISKIKGNLTQKVVTFFSKLAISNLKEDEHK